MFNNLPRLMYITQRGLMGEGNAAVETLRRAVYDVPPGNLLIYIHEKDLEGRALVALCQAWISVIRDAEQRVVIADRLDVARHVAADGVHLPEDGLDARDARRLWPEALIGRSCHTLNAVAAADGADYCTLSPIFKTPSKPAAAPLGLDVLRAPTPRPVYALGGVSPANAAEVWKTGVHGLAMLRAPWAP